MAGGALAVKSGDELKVRVKELGQRLGLDAQTECRVGRRLWGSERRIDVILTHPTTGKSIGLECKFQDKRGTAEEKIPATISDISAWPIQGLVVFAGDGFTDNMKAYLHSTGKAVELGDLEDWLRLYFGLRARTLAAGGE